MDPHVLNQIYQETIKQAMERLIATCRDKPIYGAMMEDLLRRHIPRTNRVDVLIEGSARLVLEMVERKIGQPQVRGALINCVAAFAIARKAVIDNTPGRKYPKGLLMSTNWAERTKSV